MKTLRLQFVASIVAAVVIGLIIIWADHTVHAYGDGKASFDDFQTAAAINGLLGIPVHIFFLALAVVLGGFSYSTDGSTPSWLILLAATLWAVIIFIVLRVAARIWRKLEQIEKA